jgi:hypothetical protein
LHSISTSQYAGMTSWHVSTSLESALQVFIGDQIFYVILYYAHHKLFTSNETIFVYRLQDDAIKLLLFSENNYVYSIMAHCQRKLNWMILPWDLTSGTHYCVFQSNTFIAQLHSFKH